MAGEADDHERDGPGCPFERFLETRSSDDFSLFVHSYEGFVRAVAFQALGRKHLAEDITQEVFLRLFAKPPETQGLRGS